MIQYVQKNISGRKEKCDRESTELRCLVLRCALTGRFWTANALSTGFFFSFMCNGGARFLCKLYFMELTHLTGYEGDSAQNIVLNKTRIFIRFLSQRVTDWLSNYGEDSKIGIRARCTMVFVILDLCFCWHHLPVEFYKACNIFEPFNTQSSDLACELLRAWMKQTITLGLRWMQSSSWHNVCTSTVVHMWSTAHRVSCEAKLEETIMLS